VNAGEFRRTTDYRRATTTIGASRRKVLTGGGGPKLPQVPIPGGPLTICSSVGSPELHQRQRVFDFGQNCLDACPNWTGALLAVPLPFWRAGYIVSALSSAQVRSPIVQDNWIFYFFLRSLDCLSGKFGGDKTEGSLGYVTIHKEILEALEVPSDTIQQDRPVSTLCF